MYEMKVKTPPLTQKRRSWTGRLKDRFRRNNELEEDAMFVPPAHHLVHSTTTASGADDWTTAWVSHPHLQEGHHAPSVPSLQGSVFVAANFVYDYRQKYGHENNWLNGTPGKPSIGSVAVRRSTTDWSAARGLFPVQSSSPVFRAQQPQERNRVVESAVEFRAADVNQNIRQWREFKKQSGTRVTIDHAPPLPSSPPPQPPPSSSMHDEPKTTVAVDRPGLVVTGERICILTGQDPLPLPLTPPPPLPLPVVHSEKVSVKVEFQRHCPLRRSLSDRARPKMAAPASFHDTTRLTQKSRSRGSLHDLFGVDTCKVTTPTTPATEAVYAIRRRVTRPTEPPPPPPTTTTQDGAPIAPPRRIYRYSKLEPAKSAPDEASGDADLSPGVSSWAGRPLSGQVVSWTAWSGNSSLDDNVQPSDDKSATVLLVAPAPQQQQRPSDEVKRRPVSRLWPSFSSIGRDRSVNRNSSATVVVAAAAEQSPEEHIYEEIDDLATNKDAAKRSSSALTRTGRGGSFAGASRADILRYLEELRKKHPSGMINAESERRTSPVNSPPMTPSLPQLIVPADEEDDDEMGALLLAMRHNGPNRLSNRSTQSSTSTQSSSQDSAVSASALSGSSTYQNTLLGGGAGSGGGEIERNDSGVGSETSGTAQRLRRLRRLRTANQLDSNKDATTLNIIKSHHSSESDEEDVVVVDEKTDGAWCIDCEQPIDPEDGAERLVCHRCARRRCERREVLAELLETEVRYGRDLRVLQDELYKPLLVAGLVPLRQLDAVFLNVAELASQSQRFGQRLREAVEIALEQGDEDLLTVDVARLFLDKATEEMMDAFRRYCVRSGEASLLLSSLEKERELLRIFLRASQLENPALRRMDLHAFLMVPVQRITKYPLLLGRLLRATAQQDVEMREALREAQAKVESYLTAINAEAKELGSASRPWRRGYSVPNLNLNSAATIQRPSGEELMCLRLRKMAMDCLNWPDNGTSHLVLEGHVKLTQPGELLLTATKSRGRTLKWQNIWMALVVHHSQGKEFEMGDSVPPAPETSRLTFGLKQHVHEAAVVFIKDVKNLRPGPSLFREPLMLSQCTVSCETEELPNFFEIHHMVTKESFICQTPDAGQTQQWLVKLRSLSLSLGRWKQRRNALPHVMMIASSSN